VIGKFVVIEKSPAIIQHLQVFLIQIFRTMHCPFERLAKQAIFSRQPLIPETGIFLITNKVSQIFM
jgi:hypothetical protein